MISANTLLVNLEYFIGYHSGLLDIDPLITPMNNCNETRGVITASIVHFVHPLNDLIFTFSPFYSSSRYTNDCELLQTKTTSGILSLFALAALHRCTLRY